MNVLIMTDLEGITGVNYDYMTRANDGGSPYLFACEQLMHDTNAAINGFFAGGAEKVYVYDGHSKGTNFIKSMLDKRAIQLFRDNWHDLISGGHIDAYAEVGLHAMAGAENAFLDHTQNSIKWFDYKINGISSGEFVQGAAYVGNYDIPFIFASGDDAACEEAKSFVPGICTAVVKHALRRNEAVSLPYDEARKLIYEEAKRSVGIAKNIKPYKITLPAEVSITFQRSDYCDEYANIYERINSRTIKKTVEKIENYMSLLP